HLDWSSNVCSTDLGTTTGISSAASLEKKASNSDLCSSFNTVKRGNGRRSQPSNEGGIRHTPPFPARSFCFCSSVYSNKPYGGSVTTAWIEFRARARSHSKASIFWIS